MKSQNKYLEYNMYKCGAVCTIFLQQAETMISNYHYRMFVFDFAHVYWLILGIGRKYTTISQFEWKAMKNVGINVVCKKSS